MGRLRGRLGLLGSICTLLACAPSDNAESPARQVTTCPPGHFCVHLPFVAKNYETATVDVDPGAALGGTVSSTLWGVAPGTGGWSNESNPVNAAAIQQLGARLVRYPMGCKADAHDWRTGRMRFVSGGTTYDVAGYTPEQMVDAAHSVGAKVLWVVNISPEAGMINPCGWSTQVPGAGPYSRDAAGVAHNLTDMLDALAAKGKQVDYLELGNEPWGPRDTSTNGDPDDGKWHPKEYVAVALAAAKAVKARYPQVKVGLVNAPTTGNNMDPQAVLSRQDWVSTMQSIRDRSCTAPGGTVPCFDFVTDHPYINDGYHDWVTVTANSSSDTLTAGSGAQFYRGVPVRLESSGGLPAPLSPAKRYYVAVLDPAVSRSGTFGLHTNQAAAKDGEQINLTSTGSGTHRLIIDNESNVPNRAAFLAQENFDGVHFSGLYPDMGLLDLSRHESGAKQVFLTEWDIINWVKAYNNPLNTAEHALFVGEALLQMARHEVGGATLWNCFPYGLSTDMDQWNPQCHVFRLTASLAGRRMVQTHVSSSTREIPLINATSLAALRGGYSLPNITAYAGKATVGGQPELQVFVLNKHPTKRVSVAVRLPASYDGRYDSLTVSRLTASDATDPSFTRSESTVPLSGSAVRFKLEGSSVVRLTLR